MKRTSSKSSIAFRPTPSQLRAALNKGIPDVIGPNLDVLFCGINPGLYSAAVGHHFARPGNRFWKALHLSGFTPRLLSPFEDEKLLDYRCGATNIVNRGTATAEDLTKEELRKSRGGLVRKIRRYAPRNVAVLGIGAFRYAFDQPEAKLGLQPEPIGKTQVWVLPNPSGLNAGYQLDSLVRYFQDLRKGI